MSKTIEFNGEEVRVVDTTMGTIARVPLRLTGLSVTTVSRQTVTVADGQSAQTLNFGSVTAGKIVCMVPNGTMSTKINGSSTALPVTTALLLVDTAGGYTSATFANSSGSTVTVEVLLAG